MSALLIAEHNNKEIKPFTLNAITAASQIDQDLHVLVIGHSCEAVAKSIQNGPGRLLGNAMHNGLVPKRDSLPPNGTTFLTVLPESAVMKPIIPSWAAVIELSLIHI